MNSGRHFNPPTPAYRPVDPFTGQAPRSAELIPSCETVTPPPARIRPVRIDPSESLTAKSPPLDVSVSFPANVSPPATLPLKKPLPTNMTPVPATTRASGKKRLSGPARVEGVARKTASASSASAGVSPAAVVEEGQELRTCAWSRCGKTFVVQANGRNAVRRYCSATCRGRASEARTGKR